MLSRALAVALVISAICACSKKTSEPATLSSASASVVPPTPSEAPPAPTGSYQLPPGTPGSLLSVEERFAAEAAKRPSGTPRVEDVLAAIKSAGIAPHDVQQHLGSPFGAQYCMGLKAGKDVHASVCEYKDAKTAADNRVASVRDLNIPNRNIYQNGATTLTVRIGTRTDDEDALAQKMIAAFQTVKAAAPAASK